MTIRLSQRKIRVKNLKRDDGSYWSFGEIKKARNKGATKRKLKQLTRKGTI
jgi:hypothetical protein